MKHYKIVKRGTIFTIVLAVLAVFLQLVSAVYLRNITETNPVKAEDTANSCDTTGNPADLFAYYENGSININLLTRYPSTAYSYTITVLDGNNNSVIATRSQGTENNPVPPNTFPYLITIPIPSYAQNSPLKLVVEFGFNQISSDLTQQSCTNRTTKLMPSYSDFNSGVLQDMVLTVNKESIDLVDSSGQQIENPDPIIINYRFVYDYSKTINYDYHLTITNCAGQDIEKASGILNDNNPNTISWIPSERCGTHNASIILKVYDNTTEMVVNSDSKIVTVNDGAPGGNPVDPNAGNLNPGEISVNDSHNLFGTNIKLATIDTGLGDIWNLIFNVLSYLIGVLAFLGIVYGGIMYITANGDDSKAEKAKKTILYCVVGVVLAIMAATIITLVINLVK